MRTLIREIHRRSLWQVLGIYLAGAWVALQVVDLLADNFGLPQWFPPFALALLVLGLPVVLATAFVQEGVGTRADASEPDASDLPPAPGSPGVHYRLLTWRNAAIGGVGAFALWGVIAAAWLLLGGGGPAAPAEAEAGTTHRLGRSVAVLPFVTRSVAEEDRFFAEGMHDDLLTQLAKIDSLTVISRTSVMQYANTTKSIPAIGAELGVATVLEGGVQRAGDRVRINVQLIEASTDRHLWAETYDEELTAENVFAIQSDLAREIAGALHATLSPAVERRIAVRPTASLEAFDLYTRARYGLANRAMFGEDIEGVGALFERAIAADSTFAAAWAGLAEVYVSGWNWRRLPREEAEPKAEAAIERALSLDRDLAEAHLARARLLHLQERRGEAEAAARRALELAPGDVRAMGVLARLLELEGDFTQAVTISRRAVELDPLDIGARYTLADRLFFAGRFDESVEESIKAVELSPDGWYAWYNMGWAHAAAGRPADGVEAFRHALSASPEDEDGIRMGLAYAFARGGQRDSALVQLEGLPSGVGGYDRAIVFLELGEDGRAFEALEEALRDNPDRYARLVNDPTAAALRADPRFGEIVSRLGLE